MAGLHFHLEPPRLYFCKSHHAYNLCRWPRRCWLLVSGSLARSSRLEDRWVCQIMADAHDSILHRGSFVDGQDCIIESLAEKQTMIQKSAGKISLNGRRVGSEKAARGAEMLNRMCGLWIGYLRDLGCAFWLLYTSFSCVILRGGDSGRLMSRKT
ncbi:hypothetical protein CC80DRAFT_101831 [Byssothecium circinans]|uniref:Uncharacterized protein n=1 Tax=Byssothecium circinans TaxID=147558 RepID=A0A6A5UF73_9PLEO|nr:hypothetical protein CC80DRAFT_101831 [Byssothecium circinans]